MQNNTDLPLESISDCTTCSIMNPATPFNVRLPQIAIIRIAYFFDVFISYPRGRGIWNSYHPKGNEELLGIYGIVTGNNILD